MRCIAPINAAESYVANIIEMVLQVSVSTKILIHVVLMTSNVESNVDHNIKIAVYFCLELTIKVDILYAQIYMLSTDLGKLPTRI